MIDVDKIVKEATWRSGDWGGQSIPAAREAATYAVRAALIAAAEECKNSLGRADCCVKFGRLLAKHLRDAAGGGE